MSKFLLRTTVIFIVNIFIYSYFVFVKSTNAEELAFYFFIANLLIAFFTKENNSFVQFKGVNDKVMPATLNPLENDVTKIDNNENVKGILSNFQLEKNYTGIAFASTSLVFLIITLIAYLI